MCILEKKKDLVIMQGLTMGNNKKQIKHKVSSRSRNRAEINIKQRKK